MSLRSQSICLSGSPRVINQSIVLSGLELKIQMLKVNLGSSNEVVSRNESLAVIEKVTAVS